MHTKPFEKLTVWLVSPRSRTGNRPRPTETDQHFRQSPNNRPSRFHFGFTTLDVGIYRLLVGRRGLLHVAQHEPKACCAPLREPRRGPGGKKNATYQVLFVFVKKRRKVPFKYASCRIGLTFLESQNVPHTGVWAYVLFPSIFPQHECYSFFFAKLHKYCAENSLKSFGPAAKKIPPKQISLRHKRLRNIFLALFETCCAIVIACCTFELFRGKSCAGGWRNSATP